MTPKAPAKAGQRPAQRSVGVWGNNISSNFTTGVTSTEESVYVAWQDPATRIGRCRPRTCAVKLGDEPMAAAAQIWRGLWVWALIGAGMAFVIVGLALLVGMRPVGLGHRRPDARCICGLQLWLPGAPPRSTSGTLIWHGALARGAHRQRVRRAGN